MYTYTISSGIMWFFVSILRRNLHLNCRQLLKMSNNNLFLKHPHPFMTGQVLKIELKG